MADIRQATYSFFHAGLMRDMESTSRVLADKEIILTKTILSPIINHSPDLITWLFPESATGSEDMF